MIFKQALLILVIAVAGALAQQVKVQVSTRYITTAIAQPSPKQNTTFVATLCQQFAGYQINATILLINNPTWDQVSGIVKFYIVDASNKTDKDALCTNIDKAGNRIATCVVPKWVSTGGDLFMKTTAGDVAGINFSIDVEITPVTGGNQRIKESLLRKPQEPKSYFKEDVQYLTEIVSVNANQKLTYKGQALLEVTFCPNTLTTDHYEITSTIFATDGLSSYAQYVCDKLPCQVDGDHIGDNPQQVPANSVYVTTATRAYTRIYVLIVCWAGELDPSSKHFIGQYQYSGSITKLQ